MRLVWLTGLIAVAFFVTGIGCAAWANFSERPDDIWGWITASVVLLILALVSGAVSSALWLIVQLPH